MISSEFDDLLKMNRILILSPHQDDEIFGPGGILYKFIKENKIIKVIYISNGNKGIPEAKSNPDLTLIRNQEANQVMEQLGITDYTFMGFPDGQLNTCIEDVENYLLKIIINYSPDIILIPHQYDEHPDHKVVSDIILRNLYKQFKAKLICYEVWTKIRYPNFYIKLTNEEFYKKMQLVSLYKSQLELFNYTSFIQKRMLERGEEVGCQYAEAYFIY